jgi:hypothetical protein
MKQFEWMKIREANDGKKQKGFKRYFCAFIHVCCAGGFRKELQGS